MTLSTSSLINLKLSLSDTPNDKSSIYFIIIYLSIVPLYELYLRNLEENTMYLIANFFIMRLTFF